MILAYFSLELQLDAVLFCFGVKMLEPAFISIHDIQYEVITLDSKSLKQL
jgi:hypothetical protein